MAAATTFSVTLKWSKHTYDIHLPVQTTSVADFQKHVQELTSVPIARQKLLCKSQWKGTKLPPDYQFVVQKNPLKVTLIGSAEVLKERKDMEIEDTNFVEDITPEQRRALDDEREAAAMKEAIGMIPAIQHRPVDRDTESRMAKGEIQIYNRFVRGLSQREIEEILAEQNGSLAGTEVLAMGLELRKGYINDMTVLQDGTLVSVLDDGHVQLWQHGEQVNDVTHNPMRQIPSDDGVTTVIALPSKNTGKLVFATSGRGCIRLWNETAESVIALPSPIHGVSPTNTVVIPGLSDDVLCLANSFVVTQQFDPNQFRLVPQDEQGRQRRAAAQAQVEALQQALSEASKTIQIWFSTPVSQHRPQSITITSHARITSLTTVLAKDSATDTAVPLLIAGNNDGGIKIWKFQMLGQTPTLTALADFHLKAEEKSMSIVKLISLTGDRIAVSTRTKRQDESRTSTEMEMDQAQSREFIQVPKSQAVIILNLSSLLSDATPMSLPTLDAVLDGHSDAVNCLCELPNGDLLTGGAKMDATLQQWGSEQLRSDDESTTKELVHSTPVRTFDPSIGYTFALEVLPDHKPDSKKFALAVARYNAVKIVL